MDYKLDELDKKILRMLEKDCRTPLEEIAKEIGTSKSTVYYRVKKLESQGVIKGCFAFLDAEKVNRDYVTITFIRAKYGPGYHEKVGKKLSEIEGVWAVYYIFGEIDFIILMRSNNREDYLKKLEKIMNMKEIERTSTQIVAKTYKEDPRVEL